MKKLMVLTIGFMLVLVAISTRGVEAAGEPIKIGVLLPFTGVGAYGAEQNRLGFEMGLEESGYKVAGREIKLIFEDTAGEPPTAVTKGRKLIEKHGVHLLYGPWFEHTSLALGPVTTPWGGPIIRPMAGALKMTIETPNALNFSYTEESGTVPHAQYAYEKLGYRRAILAGSDYAWGHDTAEAFEEAFRRAGGTVAEKVYIPLGTMDMAPYLDKIRAHAGDVDFMWDFVIVADGVRLHRQFYETGLQKTIQRYSTSDVMTTTLLDETGVAAVGSLAGYAWLPEIEVPASRKFIQNFEKKYPGKAADWFAACGYQGAKIILTALQDIGGKAEDKEGFLRALVEVKVKPEDNIYTDGILTFDPKYRAPIVDQYLSKIVEVDGKAKRQVIDVIKGVPPKMLPGFKD